MLSIKSGDIGEAAILFERYHVDIYKYFINGSGDGALSEDLTQNVFERMIKYRKSFHEKSKFNSWLFAIAKNVRYDHYRKNKLKLDALTNRHEDLHEVNALENDMQWENEQRLQKAFELLDHSYREVLYLTRYKDMKYKEVAELLDCTENTIKSKVHRAINKLKSIYWQIGSI